MDNTREKYSFDTSAFINTWTKHYRPNSFSGLWKKLDKACEEGAIYASEEVFEEIRRQEDELFKWCRKHEKIFVPHTESVQTATREILSKYKRLIDSRLNRNGADPFVIGLARVMGLTVVTYECGRASKDRPNIPYVCDAFNVRCVTFADFIEERGWKF